MILKFYNSKSPPDPSLSDKAKSVTINNVEDIPLWLWMLAFIGWLLPTPQQMATSTYNAISDFFFGKRRRHG